MPRGAQVWGQAALNPLNSVYSVKSSVRMAERMVEMAEPITIVMEGDASRGPPGDVTDGEPRSASFACEYRA